MALAGCGRNDGRTLFRKLDSRDHQIHFINQIQESDSLNILTLEYIYNGGGVGVADFNNDGLSDIFLTGNMVDNALYMNLGGMRFEDVSQAAGIAAPGKWKSGMAIADINADGLKDIYVCATISDDSANRQNMLFINKGINSDGVPVFEDQAVAYGVNYAGYSSGAAFLDYDRDNDLDLYIITNRITKEVPTSYREKLDDGSYNADVLFQNNGNGTFTDVSRDVGIVHEGYGLGIAISDINKDGWPDIYVSNDYITNDLMYINNGGKTFTNQINERIKHQSQFSMGNDIADFNNDGYPDIVTLDMLPEGNLRRKTVIAGGSYSNYINNSRYGYGYQYVRNMLQLNNGDGTFSEIGQMAGVHQTEWSWSPLFMDVDNDGLRDLFITNGFPRDVTDKDFANFRAETGNIASVAYQIDSIPVVKVANYAFKNSGNLTFTDMTTIWGLNYPSFSNGASFADLDNDGDLDYIVNNINDQVSLFENQLNSVQNNSRHYLRIKLHGPGGNIDGFGSKVTLHCSNFVQYHDHSVARGYISSVEEIIHFGLDSASVVDSLVCEWADGKKSILRNIKADQLLNIHYENATLSTRETQSGRFVPWLQESGVDLGIRFLHQEEDKIDFNIQRTIPHKFSQAGPSVAVGDVNGDGLDDFYIGAPAGKDGTLFIQTPSGTFMQKALFKSATKKEEDQGALFFDADGDQDIDLYVVSGSFEWEANDDAQQDRLYLNDGKGEFRQGTSQLPDTRGAGSCVRANDIDADGDLDLFVGGDVVPGKYPYASESYLLLNEHGRFVNRTMDWCSDLMHPGIVNDAIFSDVDGDGRFDLLLAGELMPVSVFRNTGSKFERMIDTGLENYYGWWNSITGSDFDYDGDIDFIVGNLGLNNYYNATRDTPLRVYAKDFDGNSSVDAILSCYLKAENGLRREFPVHFWEELNSQSPKFRRKFSYYKKYGKATMADLLTDEERRGMDVYITNYTASSYLENRGGGRFVVRSLPIEAQVAPVNGIVNADVNEDGFVDVLLVGNDYGNEIFTGRYDAFRGCVLENDGVGNFRAVAPSKHGFKVDGDAKALALLAIPGHIVAVAGQNRDSLKIFARKISSRMMIEPRLDEVAAELMLDDGRTQRAELYFGAGYFSQSTRKLPLSHRVKSVVIIDSRGRRRTIPLPAVLP